jgi:hypothetical protein
MKELIINHVSQAVNFGLKQGKSMHIEMKEIIEMNRDSESFCYTCMGYPKIPF